MKLIEKLDLNCVICQMASSQRESVPIAAFYMRVDFALAISFCNNLLNNLKNKCTVDFCNDWGYFKIGRRYVFLFSFLPDDYIDNHYYNYNSDNNDYNDNHYYNYNGNNNDYNDNNDNRVP